ncbi:MAG: SDR family NAD(P)-dependent oxidoreductase [Gemmatimonadetes bacterium]|nr:SDR family NAD(P)-dependent oxidoreductase [Gemmatimonadota bacterium]
MTLRPLACITGATAGIGLEFARQLAARQHDLVLVARDGARLSATCETLQREFGVRATPIVADLSTAAGTADLADRIRTAPVDVLVHNAGFGTKGLLHLTDGAAQAAMVALHVTATDALVRAAVPGMRERGHGHLIVVSSVASFTPSAGNVNYAATKAYQRVYMESLALELAGSGVTAQALCPGFTHTEFHARARMNMSGIPRGLWLPAQRVVQESLDAMRVGAPAVVIPGRRWRIITFLLRHLPIALLRRGAKRYAGTRTTAA